MNKKNNLKKVAALLLGAALVAGSTGCNFIVTNSEKDLAQTVAEVDISKSLKEDAKYASVAGDVAKMIANLSSDISKRDLVAYFLSTGYQYVESYGMSYEATFNMLMNSLTSREIMIQYAVAYYLAKEDAGISVTGYEKYKDAQLEAASKEEKELLKANPEVLTLKYLLTDGGKTDDESMEDYNRAVYNLKKSLNDSLDSWEESYIKAEAEEHDHAEARTLPTAVGTEKEDYFTTDYEVYTGLNAVSACGEYEKVEGSTPSTRQNAYNAFLANLQTYNMISTSGKIEDTSDITRLNYYYVELSSLLGQALISKYNEDLAKEVTDKIDGAYAEAKYEEIYAEQEQKYADAKDPSAYASAMDSASDSSFLLYGVKNFGYVYNILIPFSTSQSVRYEMEKTKMNNKDITQDELYNKRKAILSEVKASDLRGSWISEHEHANYSNVLDKDYVAGNDVKFFQDYFVENAKYEALTRYAGNLPYQGDVVKNEDGEWEATPKKIGMDDKDGEQGFIKLFENYITKTINVEGIAAKGDYVDTYKDTTYTFKADKDGDGKLEEYVDYSKFVYYTGSIENLGNATASDYFDEDSNLYKAVSAVNELMFAYSTDTGCLNTFLGYSVSPYTTNYVKEFEYAAQEAVKKGPGSYTVCATDYGWHIIFVSYARTEDGPANVYAGYNHDDALNKEGSFSNLFYEALKASATSTYSTEVQNSILNQYNNEDSVTLYKENYQDLLDLQ